MKKTLITIFTLAVSTLTYADINISDMRVRAVPPTLKMTGGFMSIHNSGETMALISAESPIANNVELHTHVKDGEVMRMRKVPKIELPKDKTIQLKPGSYHIMFIGLKQPLKVNDNIPVTLNFNNNTHLDIMIPVKGIHMKH